MRLVALLLVMGCGDNLADPGLPHSGQRLKLGWYVYEDGTRQRDTSWYFDARLEQRCRSTAWSDGNRYCAPAADEAVYVSDSCTRAVGRTRIDAAPAAHFATRFYLAGEPLPSRVFQRGAATSAPITIFERNNSGCIGPLEPGDGFVYFELGEELDSLVQLRRSEPYGAGRLALIDEISDDGLRVPVAVFDQSAGAECRLTERPNSIGTICEPADLAIASYFHDAACTEPVLATSAASPPSLAKLDDVATSCTSYFHVGGEVTAPPLYERIGGVCVATAPPGGQRFFVMDGPGDVASMSRERNPQDTDRLHRIERFRDEIRFDDPFLFDDLLDAECRRDVDDRCVPATGAQVQSWFADPQCQTAIDVAAVPSGSCDVPRPRFARSGDTYFIATGPRVDTTFELSTGDTCKPYLPPAPLALYEISSALARTSFAAAELQIDP
jgi:hypothetical protein